MAQQQHAQLGVPPARRLHQGRVPVLVVALQVGARVQQDPAHVDKAAARGVRERGVATALLCANVGLQ